MERRIPKHGREEAGGDPVGELQRVVLHHFHEERLLLVEIRYFLHLLVFPALHAERVGIGMIAERRAFQDAVLVFALRLPKFIGDIRFHRDQSAEHDDVSDDPRRDREDRNERRDAEPLPRVLADHDRQRTDRPAKSDDWIHQGHEPAEDAPRNARCQEDSGRNQTNPATNKLTAARITQQSCVV